MRWWICLASLLACETPEPSKPTHPPPAVAPLPPPSACTRDADCNFADPCQPQRCVALPARAACGQTPSGSCVCFEGRCAMRPLTARISTQSCKDSGDCDVDVATAQCEPGIVSDDEFQVRFSGPICRCLPTDQRCHLHWFDPVSCKSDDDCWLDELPVQHAIPRPKRLKGRKFRGCVDGEDVPSCVDGRCTIRALAC